MPNNLTDTEIKKALECYRGQKMFAFNGKKPEIYIHDIIDLINRQEEENRHLDQESDILRSDVDNLNRICDEVNAENESLKAEVERLQNTIAIFTQNSVDFANEIKRQKEDKDDAFRFAADIVNAEKIVIAEAKAEAYKEFAERLKETFPQDDFFRSTKRISEDINNLLK